MTTEQSISCVVARHAENRISRSEVVARLKNVKPLSHLNCVFKRKIPLTITYFKPKHD